MYNFRLFKTVMMVYWVLSLYLVTVYGILGDYPVMFGYCVRAIICAYAITLIRRQEHG